MRISDWSSDVCSSNLPAFYIGNGLDPNVYIARPYADAPTRMKAFIAFARNIPRAADQIRVNLQTPLPVSYIDYGTAGFTGLADYFTSDAKAAFAEENGRAACRERGVQYG